MITNLKENDSFVITEESGRTGFGALCYGGIVGDMPGEVLERSPVPASCPKVISPDL